MELKEDIDEEPPIPEDEMSYVAYAGITEGVVMLFSACIIGYASYYFVALGPIMSSLTFGAATVASLVASVLLFIVGACTEGSIIGQSYKLEGILEYTVLAMIIVVLSSGISLLVYRENFENVKNNNVQAGLDNTVLTYSLAVFHECCSLENELPKACGIAPVFPCYEDESKFNKFLGIAPCGLLRTKGQVSSVDPNSCANQELIPFVSHFMDFLYEETTNFGATVTGLGVIMLLMSLGVSACMYLAYVGEDSTDYAEKEISHDDAAVRHGDLDRMFRKPDVLQASKDKDVERIAAMKKSKRAKKRNPYEEEDTNPHNLRTLEEEIEIRKGKANIETNVHGNENAEVEVEVDDGEREAKEVFLN